MRRLIVTEKFNASIRIATILSGGKSKRSYVEGTPVFEFAQGEDRVQVVGLRGHIINLDYPDALNDWARVDLKELVWAEPQKVVTAGKIGAALKTLAAQSDEVVIATDFDREGELIGVEALALIREARPEIRVRRPVSPPSQSGTSKPRSRTSWRSTIRSLRPRSPANRSTWRGVPS